MKLILLLWTLFVLISYALCVSFQIDVFLILWILLACFGLVFFLADAQTAKTLDSKKTSILSVSESDINQQIEDRRKAILEDKSPISTALAYAAVPLILCLLHHYLFM